MRPVIRTRFGRRSVPGEVDDELSFHIDMRARQLMSSGLPPDEAIAEAKRLFGDLSEVRDNCVTYDEERLRSMNRLSILHDIRQDLGYAARMLRRAPMVSMVVILTLALGIGANTAIFSLVNAVLLRKLPVKAPDELIVLGDPTRVSSMGYDSNPRADIYNYKTYRALADQGQWVSGLAASGRVDRLDLRIDGARGQVERTRGRMVSGNYFEVLGVPAFLGRTLNKGEDDVVGGSPAIVISHGFWQRRFAGDSSAVGREVLINEARYTIAGVTPPSFTGEIVGVSIDVWIPIAMQPVLAPNTPILDDAQAYWLLLIGRLKPGVSLEQARSGFTELARRTLADQATVPALVADAKVLEIPISSGARGVSRVRNTYKAPLLILMTGVGLLLLIICANVANILTARAVARTREMSVRLAIGAGRGRLVRQLLTESLLLAGMGAGAGLLASNWMSRYLLVLAADGGTVLPLDTGVGLAALVFTSALGLVAVVAFGLMPALRASRVEVADAMRASGKALTGSGAGQRHPLGRLLIAGQVALSVILIVGAGLLVRSLQHLQRTDTGLDRDKILVVDVDAGSRGYEEGTLTLLASQLQARLARLPGVAGVSFNENGIFTGTESATNVGVPGYVAQQRQDSISYYDQVGPGFVKVVGARLTAGREFNESDREGTAPVVMINESFAKKYFGDKPAVGSPIRLGDSTYAEVIGVVADIKDQTLVGATRRRYYVSYLQHPTGTASVVRMLVRTQGDPSKLVTPVRKAIAEVDADLPVRDVDPLARLMRESLSEERLLATLATVFGMAALLLAAIGLYGVMSYAVSRRAGEIGLRVALGATRAAVIRMVLRDAMLLVCIGIIVGVPLTFGASRIIRSQLHGVEPTDPVTFVVALGILTLGALTAALLPALRASRVAPVVALRAE